MAMQPKPMRLQASFVSEDEVHRVVKSVIEHNPSSEEELDTSITEREPGTGTGFSGDGEADDALFEEAKQVVLEQHKASSSLLQRRLRVGYARAARLIDMLEERGVISPGEGNKPREILAQAEAEPADHEIEPEEQGEDHGGDTFTES